MPRSLLSAGLPHLLRTTSFRLAALYVAMFVASACILGAAVYVAAESSLREQMTERIASEARLLRQEFDANGVNHLVATIRTRERGVSALEYGLLAPDGTLLAGEMVTAPRRPGWAVVTVQEGEEDGGKSERVRALVSDLGGGFLLAVGDGLGRIGEVQEAVAAALAWSVGLAAVLGIGGGALLSRAFLARVDAISRTAEAIIGGDLARRIPIRGTGDDLDRLARTLNRMLDRIGTLMESLRQVSSDVAHDLRTPLSRLFQRLEHAQAHAGSAAEFREAVSAALREAEGLLEIFSALLRIAQVEGSSPRSGFRDVDLTGVAEAVADAYMPDAEVSGRILVAEIAAGIVIHGDQELLTQAMSNLVENALRHTPAGTRIVLGLSGPPAAGVCLWVADDGPGVAPDDLPRLRDRFYRGERSRTAPGNGLGLSLVAAVAELHHATLELADTGPGFRARLRFPTTAAAPGGSETSSPA